MLLRERRVLPVPPRAAWEVVGDPALVSLWNPKCIRCDALDSAPLIGSRYDAVFRLGDRERDCKCEIVELLPESCIRLRYSFSDGHVVEETFQLREVARGTELTQTVDFSQSGIPWLLRSLFWLMHKFARSTGKSALDGIAALASGGDKEPPHERQYGRS